MVGQGPETFFQIDEAQSTCLGFFKCLFTLKWPMGKLFIQSKKLGCKLRLQLRCNTFFG